MNYFTYLHYGKTIFFLWQCLSTAGAQLLFHNLSADYDVNAWPTMDDNEPTIVDVQMHLNTFGSLNAEHMDFKIDMFLRQRWNDKRLTHNDSKTDHFTVLDPALQSKIWKPDSYFENAKEGKIHGITMPNMLLTTYRNGSILYVMRMSLRLSCHLELKLYPFDSQKCHVKLSSYSNTRDVVQYRWSEIQPIEIPDDLEVAQFDLVSNRSSLHFSVYDSGLYMGNYSGVTATFTLTRQSGYHILQTYVPTVMIVCISWVSFWLDPNAIPGRVTLGVTTLLTLTTLATGVRQTLPPVSYVKAIDVWMGMCMAMVFGALVEFTFANFLANKKMLHTRIPDLFTVPKFLAGPPDHPKDKKKQENSPIELIGVHPVDGCDIGGSDVTFRPSNFNNNNEEAKPVRPKKQGVGDTYMFYALVVDRLSRLLFPLSFIIFNIAYWPFFVYLHYTNEKLLILDPNYDSSNT